MLDLRFIKNLVFRKIVAIRLLNRVTFYISRIGYRNKRVFDISICKTKYLCNDLIQRTLRVINLDPSFLD